MLNKNFTVYKSSAGSGKTFTLVKEYLALALNDESDPPQAYRHILAITFTNKAASEMKERIIKALKELASDDYSAVSNGTKILLQELKKHVVLNKRRQLDDNDVRKRANNVLTAVLHNYSDFAIGTIDSFVHKIVRTFAFDLKIPMSFELEMDEEKLLTQSIDLLIAKVGTDERLTKALVEFTESKTDDEKSWHIENELKYFAKNLLNEEGAVYIEKLKQLSVDDFFKIKDVLKKHIHVFESAVAKEAQQAVALIEKNGLTAKAFYYTDKGIAGYFHNLGNGKFDKIEANSYVRTTVGEDKWHGSKINSDEQKSIDAIKYELLDSFNNIQVLKENDYADYILFKLISTTIYSVAVLNEIEKLLIEYKTQNNILHISEFNKMIAKVVMNEPIPFIYERLGEKYNNYLVDEFQDTSVLQFQNLLPLIDNSLASDHFTMLVGDGKQAIYRWRGGEVEQFAMLPHVFSHNDNPLVMEREDALVRNYNPQVLNKNYRSKREIIEFNNSIFKVLSGKLNEKYRSIYDTLQQEFDAENTGGFVQMEFLDDETETLENLNYERTLAIINELLEQNFQLKDIAVLVRKNSDGSAIANYLTQNNIPVISSDSLLLSNSAEVNFIHSLLKYLNNSKDEIVQAEIIEYLVANHLMKDIAFNDALANKKTDGLLSLLKKVVPEFNTYILSKMPLYELNEELIRLFKLNATPNAYIQFYLDEVLNYTLKQNNNLADFIEYWTDKKEKASLIIPQGMNAVTIMTIHRAKGLEFPAVILPFAMGRVEKGKKHLWLNIENELIEQLPAALVASSESLGHTPYGNLYRDEKDKSLLDSLNVLYVALTRPEERLYILSCKPSQNTEKLNSIQDMFACYYQTTGEWNEENKIYTFGKVHTHKLSTTNHQLPTTNYQLRTFNSNQWRNTIKMRAAAPSIWNLELAEKKKDYGVMVHTALARVRSTEDIEQAVKGMFAEGLITSEEQEHLKTTIHKITDHPQLKDYFKQGVTIKNEAEIILSTGELFRPDRVVLNNKTAVIIDYKTGEEKDIHKKQILQYADLLNQMGYIVTEKLLVYIENEKSLLPVVEPV